MDQVTTEGTLHPKSPTQDHNPFLSCIPSFENCQQPTISIASSTDKRSSSAGRISVTGSIIEMLVGKRATTFGPAIKETRGGGMESFWVPVISWWHNWYQLFPVQTGGIP